jgi:hypothetical protein
LFRKDGLYQVKNSEIASGQGSNTASVVRAISTSQPFNPDTFISFLFDDNAEANILFTIQGQIVVKWASCHIKLG